MVEALEQFQEKITKKAIKFFSGQIEVSFENFHNFVNARMGTEFNEEFTTQFYKHFLKIRMDKKE
jgi:hypothetical protein